MFKIIKFIFFVVFFKVYAQQEKEMHMPLNIPLNLSGTFGEIRSNHFHSGLDIKTQGTEGLPVFAVDKGFIYRIKISRKGYGKVLYIKHPSGLVSVYGHLKKFNPVIEEYIKQKQYKKQKNELEVFPYKIELPVRKGEIIAYSGNTGGSYGPHLHFEIRDQQEHPLNPMSFGFVTPDTIPPILRGLFAYTLDDEAHINQVQGRIPLFFHKENDSTFTTDSIIVMGKIGWGIDAYDRQNNSYNRNGLYKVQTYVNGTLIYEHVLEELSFFWTHYVNVFIDYAYYKQKHKKIQKLFVEPFNHLEIYTHLVNDGIINVLPKRTYNVTIVLQDFNKNKIRIKIPVYGLDVPIVEKVKKKKTGIPIKAGEKKEFDLGKLKIITNKNTAYYDFYLQYKKLKNGFEIKNNDVPLHKSIIFKYDISDIKPSLRKYLYLGRKVSKKTTYYTYSKIKNDTLVAYSTRMGIYKISYDSIPPKLFPVNFREKANLTNYHFLRLETFDLQTGIKNYEAYIDNEWIRLEYDYKKNSLIYNFDDKKLSGYKHYLKVIVTDNVGNKSIYETTFYRKEN